MDAASVQEGVAVAPSLAGPVPVPVEARLHTPVVPSGPTVRLIAMGLPVAPVP